MAIFQLVLLVCVVVCLLVLWLAFGHGERKRSGAAPRTVSSVGEGLRLAAKHPGGGRVLVLFAAGEALAGAWGDDPQLAADLAQRGLILVGLREDDPQVLDHLYAKYGGGQSRPAQSASLLLDHEGTLLEAALVEEPLAAWIRRWA